MSTKRLPSTEPGVVLSLGSLARNGATCAHCGFPMRGTAMVRDQPVCHTGPPFPDCYRLVTVWQEPIGSRRPRQDTPDQGAD